MKQGDSVDIRRTLWASSAYGPGERCWFEGYEYVKHFKGWLGEPRIMVKATRGLYQGCNLSFAKNDVRVSEGKGLSYPRFTSKKED